jgi:hypothetical protein
MELNEAVKTANIENQETDKVNQELRDIVNKKRRLNRKLNSVIRVMNDNEQLEEQ